MFRSLGDDKQFRSSRSLCAIVQFYNLPSKFELAILIRYYIYIGTREAGVKRLDWIVSSNITKEQMDGYIERKQDPYCRFHSFLIYSFSIFLILNCFSPLLTFLFFYFIVFVSPDIRMPFFLLYLCMSDFVQSIEHGNRSASRSGWRRCVAVVATSSPHRGSRVRQSTTVPVRQLRPLRILKAGLPPAPSWRAQKRKKRTPSRNSPWQRNDILQFRLPLSPLSHEWLLARNEVQNWMKETSNCARSRLVTTNEIFCGESLENINI